MVTAFEDAITNYGHIIEDSHRNFGHSIEDAITAIITSLSIETALE